MDDLDALLADLQSATSHLQQQKQTGPPPPPQQPAAAAPQPQAAPAPYSAGHQHHHHQYHSPYPQPQVKSSTVTTHYHTQQNEASSSPSPTSPSSHPLVHNGDFITSQAYTKPPQPQPHPQPGYHQHSYQHQPIYEPTQQHSPAPPPPPAQPQPSHQPQQQSPVHSHYAHESPRVPPKPTYQPSSSMSSTLNSNLSELDSLLEDLQAAQYAAQPPPPQAAQTHTVTTTQTTVTKKAPPAVAPKPKRPEGNGPAPAVSDDVIDSVPGQQTRTVVTVTQTHHHPVQHQEPQPQHVSPVHRQQMQAGPPPRSASTATKELDDLMASLSDFKMSTSAQGGPQHARPADASYAQQAPKQVQRQPAPQAVAVTTHAEAPKGSQLDSMLGHLQSDMNRHGVQTVPKGHCAACNKAIVGQLVTALGKTWHPEHFTCSHCQVELGTQNFFERDGQPFCDKDYHNLFSPRCAYCHGPILEKCVTALDKTWHPEHFFCAQCGRHFADEGFHEKDGKAFCRDDYFDMFAPKCAGCNRAIMENYISALNVQWHPECFVCTECRTPFNGGSFFDHDGRPYCEIHYHAIRGSLCSGCNKPITGRCITAMQKKFHPEHFVCAFCLKQLNKGTFKEQNDKPYCHPCFVKLFG